MKVEPFDGDSRVVSAVVAEWSFKPFRWVHASADALTALSASRIGQTIGRDGVRAWKMTGSGARVCGIAALEPLPWDSRMLGRPAARAEFVVTGGYESRRRTFAALLDTVLGAAQAAGVQHLSVRVDAADDAAIHALESAAFLSVDALLTFERPVSNSGAPEADEVTIRDVRSEDVAAVESLAAASFRDGRFHTDPSVSPEVAAAIYREWAASCCGAAAADGVLVATKGDGAVVGFVACRIQHDTGVYLGRLTATIVLIATAVSASRQGIGRSIVRAALAWAGERSVAAMQVGTQLRNTGASRLYEQCGFRLACGSQSFRAVMNS